MYNDREAMKVWIQKRKPKFRDFLRCMEEVHSRIFVFRFLLEEVEGIHRREGAVIGRAVDCEG